jgi:hypothetical protein
VGGRGDEFIGKHAGVDEGAEEVRPFIPRCHSGRSAPIQEPLASASSARSRLPFWPRQPNALVGGSGSTRSRVARWRAEDGEELLAAVGVGDEGDGLIAEGVEEFVGAPRW